MSHTTVPFAPALRMPRQSAGIDRHGSSTAALGGDSGVEPAILPVLLGGLLTSLLTSDPVQNTISDVVDGIGDFFSGLFG
ncbi:hypothetical protein AB0M80_21525 [Amycolatopsis sp. NPDC051045]|uniref:hypothetical protein n=1 Tax=Amycolatopsis sp. NPDC051045 TaxID=3156922 RepID=UPI00342A35E0